MKERAEYIDELLVIVNLDIHRGKYTVYQLMTKHLPRAFRVKIVSYMHLVTIGNGKAVGFRVIVYFFDVPDRKGYTGKVEGFNIT